MRENLEFKQLCINGSQLLREIQSKQSADFYECEYFCYVVEGERCSVRGNIALMGSSWGVKKIYCGAVKTAVSWELGSTLGKRALMLYQSRIKRVRVFECLVPVDTLRGAEHTSLGTDFSGGWNAPQLIALTAG